MSQPNTFTSIELDLLAAVAGGAGPTFKSPGMSGDQFSRYNRSMINTTNLKQMLKAPIPNVELSQGGIIIGNTPYIAPPITIK